jgi:GLPGLI family protein
MKKIILSAALAFMAIGSTVAQVKEGSITYEVNVDGLPPEQAAMLSGMEMKAFFKTGKSRMELSSAFFNQISVNDGKKTTVLMDQMGQKFYYEITEEEAKKQESKGKDPVIEYKDETKKIAGYDCKKALIKNKDEKGEETVTTVWYTEQLPYTNQGSGRTGKSMFKGLKGAPLEFEVTQGPLKMKFTATEVSKAAVPDSKFVANTDGYVKKSLDDLKKPAGGGGN